MKDKAALILGLIAVAALEVLFWTLVTSVDEPKPCRERVVLDADKDQCVAPARLVREGSDWLCRCPHE